MIIEGHSLSIDSSKACQAVVAATLGMSWDPSKLLVRSAFNEVSRSLLTSDKRQLSGPHQTLDRSLRATGCPAIDSAPAAVMDYVLAALADNTRRAYASDLRHFLGWGGTIPASDGMIAQYMVKHAATLSIATLTRRLVAIGLAHTAQGFPSPTTSQLVRLAMRGIRHRHGRPQRRVAAATMDQVVAMVAGLGNGLRNCRNRALLLIGFAGAFRRSELVAINIIDIERAPEGIVITLRRSKTDQGGDGRRVGIPYAHGSVCPVKALDAWLTASGISEGPIFRPIDRHGHIDAKALSGEAVALIIKERAEAVMLDPTRYSGHSLRARLATSAAIAGVPSWKIRGQTGHASHSMLHRYIRDGELFIGNAAGAVFSKNTGGNTVD